MSSKPSVQTLKRIGRLHVITSETLQTRFSHVDIADLCSSSGADVIQFREKRNQTTQDQVQTLTNMQAAMAGGDCTLVVNDRSDIAKAVGAHLHIGPHDITPQVARGILGPDAIIGATANNLAMLRQLSDAPIDYVGVGPVFGTTSKENPSATLGIDGLRSMVEQSPFPVIAIGSIQADQVQSVLETGAHGVAVISGIVIQDDPKAACKRYRSAIDQFLKTKAKQ